MEADMEWPVIFERFFQRTELFQCLQAMQLEATVFASAAQDDLYDNLARLSEDIQALLLSVKQRQPAPSGQGDAASDHKMELDSAESQVRHEHDLQLPEDSTSSKKRKAHAQDIVQSALTKEQTLEAIDSFVARQRKEIDINNQDEFLVPPGGRDATCARIDAKGTNRGVQIQLDVAFNDTNALERSTPAQPDTHDDSKDARSLPLDGLVERVDNLSEHLSVRFSPSPTSIYNRVAALEDHLMMLEREFPPWSAEHFNQPGRNYTHPPPATVYRILPASVTAAGPPAIPPAAQSISPSARTRGAKRGRPRSSARYLGRGQPTPRRNRTAAQVNSPLDPTGKPLFHICGRGVNSSLTRTVLAKLQSKQTPAEQKSGSNPPSST
ncbi:hypothetical protein GGH94_000436 [Coemansia aciculifera]|uniref:Uncharacterized protein n=1 Tax=Coemansia aciculifera TaxID=417176 RepID=A0A9W8IN94_9FUNG|nr:hypothetical protein GGH94_000436 [Coemansia aciculifera]KAJ2876951.1 hypothetical protein GGH93_000326 [Coemansia aciculifera]